jgi:GST-like protein
MIDLHYWPTPNGQKIRLFLEESGLEHRLHKVNIGKGEQFDPAFLAISPNNRIPAIVDQNPADGGPALSMFESGAILLYLADKIGRFIPSDLRGHATVTQWLFWQMAGLGPMAGQAGHFRVFAPEKIPYGIERYTKEVARLYGVLDRQLEGRDFIAGEYSIADIACYPWIVPHEGHGQSLDDIPNVKRWFETIAARPAVQRTYAEASTSYKPDTRLSEEERRVLFGGKK